MRFVGVDLAWGQRNPTGLCLVEGDRVVETALLRGDAPLREWLAAATRAPCVVGVDAPLIVRNRTGARPCERALDRCFRRFEAGCHPTNTTLVPPRAERLADALGLSTDPEFPAGAAVRRIVEVYPHAALVALFALDVTLKYKARSGRSTAARSAAFGRLLELLRRLRRADPPLDVTTAPRWRGLVTTVTTSRVGAALDRAEDELDAIVCAYVAAHLWRHGPARNRIVGDVDTGYVVTPVTPALARCLDHGADP